MLIYKWFISKYLQSLWQFAKISKNIKKIKLERSDAYRKIIKPKT